MNVTSKLTGIPLLTWVFLCTCAHAWKLDCTKFVFAPRCRGVAAKRGGDMTSYMGQKWPEDTWLLYNRPSSHLPEEATGEVNPPHPQGLQLPTVQDNDKVLRLLSQVLGLPEEERRPPHYAADRRTNMDRMKVYFDALLQSLEDTAEDTLKENVMTGEA